MYFLKKLLHWNFCFKIITKLLKRQLIQRCIVYFSQSYVRLDIIKVLLPIGAQEIFFKRSIKIYIKTAPTCFGVITIIREPTIDFAKVTDVKTVN